MSIATEAPTPDADILAVTPAAAAKISQLAVRDGRPAVLRVRVLAGGCSGFTYELGFAESTEPDDTILERDGASVVIDPASAPILQGSTLEFVDTMMGGGLKVLNPQAVHECACGQSFSI